MASAIKNEEGTHTLNRYKLTAKGNGTQATVLLMAYNDTDAMFESIFTILDLAMTSEVWAKGEITLLNNAGEIVNTMEGKN